MSERKTISVVCVFAAGEEDGYPHLEGLFKEGKEYIHLSITKRKKYSSLKMIKFHLNGVLNTTAVVSGLSKVWN